GAHARPLVRRARRVHDRPADGSHRRHRRRPARPAAASGLASGQHVRPARHPARDERRELVDVERLRPPLLGPDPNHAHHDFRAATQIPPNMRAGHSGPKMRPSLLPTSAMDGAGNIYVVWQTRSFRVGSVASTPNDIAMSIMPAPTAANPNPSFGPPFRIPIE